ncbi:MAG: zinc ribbon domain-containing protein, partial [Promethearchaeota archaeon]
KIASPFTIVYLAFLISTIIVFSIAIMISTILPEVGMLLLAGSLLMAVFGYMILMSRDITINIYLEKIYLRNVALEVFQIFFMFVNIVMILLEGLTIDWFRYYLIESTFNIGAASIPRLYISIFVVFFTSLVLVSITTYMQLRKTVKNLQEQRSQGASSNLLLYLKDQDSSRLITRLGYKTIVFLVSVLIGIVTTTNLLTEETTFALLIVIIPFAIAGFLALIIHRFFEIKSKKEEKEEVHLPFSDSKKFCSKCGEEMYLSDKFCGSCGSKQIFEDIFGTYISRCTDCDAFINDKAKYCTECGKQI